MHVTAGRADDVTALLRGCWLEDDGDEPGAELHRVAIKGIDYHKGTATGYLAKYIAKNIDGTGVADDFEAEIDTASSIVRVDAWAATHGIRQFQQFGGPPIGLWRELRRLRSATSIDLIERARYAADQGDYAGFVEAVGGIVSGRKTLLHLWKQTVAGLNRYGERFRDRIVGLRTCTARLLTWFKQWRIISRDGLAAFLAALRSQGALSTAAPPVNAPEPEPGQQPSE